MGLLSEQLGGQGFDEEKCQSSYAVNPYLDKPPEYAENLLTSVFNDGRDLEWECHIEDINDGYCDDESFLSIQFHMIIP